MNKTYLNDVLPFWFWIVNIISILFLSIYGRRLQSRFFSQIDMMWLAVAVFGFLFLVLFILYKKRNVYNISKNTLVGAVLLISGGGLAVYTKNLLPIETMHFFVFFCFGWLTVIVFGVKYGLFVVLAVAVSDEILQFFLPDRVGDMHDVVVNGLSGIVGLLLGKR